MREWLRELQLGDAAVELGYNLNSSYGRTPTTSRPSCCLPERRFPRHSGGKLRPGSSATRFRDGVQRIPEAMARTLHHQVRLNDDRSCASKTAGTKAAVHCADGTVWWADRVICALPFSALAACRDRSAAHRPPSRGRATLPYQP